MRLLIFFLVLLLLASDPIYAQTSGSAITAAELREHVKYLASDELDGRGSGTEGNAKAAIYIAVDLKRWGMKPAGDNGTFFQTFDFTSAVKPGEANALMLETGGKLLQMKPDKDFRPFGFSSNDSVSAPIVFVGYGISAPDKSYDDYEGVDVKGKIVLMFRFAPDGSGTKSDFQKYTALRNKARVARDKGAVGLMMVTGPADAADDDLPKMTIDKGAGSSGIPAISITRASIETSLQYSGWSLAALQDKIRGEKKPLSFEIKDASASLRTDIVRVISQTSNVIAYIEGNDPVLKDEVIVLGAHMDHLGKGGPGSGSMVPDTIAIHNGADDNASGCAALLELAQAFAARANTLKRSFVFIFFSGEELGTLGSGNYVAAPFFPLKQTVSMINLDMVGRLQNKILNIGGSGTSPAWSSLLKKYNADTTFTLVLSPDGFGPSDHGPFYGKDIPVLFFFTGVHDDYHKPSDDWDKLDYEGEEKISQYAYRIVSDIDSMAVRPGFTRVESPAASRPGGGDSRGFSVTLGIVPDVAESSTGMKVSGIRPNGAAEKAGIKAGDIIMSMGGKKILNVYDYMGMLGELKAGDSVEIEVQRDGKPLKVTAVMQKRN
jgi:hypothetical protein